MIDPYLDEQYDARALVGNADETLAEHRVWSDEVRQDFPPTVIRYGNHALELADVFVGSSQSPVIFLVHGGYWRGSSRKDVTFLTSRVIAQDTCVVSVDYPLAPDTPLLDIIASVQAAYAWVCRNIADYGGDPQKITVIGHSAGAHLVASLLEPTANDNSWQPPQRFIGVSGLYDLQPLLATKTNSWLALDHQTAKRLSPALWQWEEIHTESLLIAGALESTEFRRQSDQFAQVLRKAGAPVTRYDIEGTGHFDVLNALMSDDILDVQGQESRQR
ncbi:alpha/beta hydrolase [Corynebacterium sp. A21]|uniref:alpha/beta hydrolase n=1 Tax=Corynebacterium sp. A21 TaxID=3457318 RepID=UPI003FCFFA1E